MRTATATATQPSASRRGPDGYTDNGLDCDDTASLVSPGVEEVCNGIDDNCDGRADEGRHRLYPDADDDGFGDTSAGIISCWDLTDHVTTPGDCNDDDETINPDADEAAMRSITTATGPSMSSRSPD